MRSNAAHTLARTLSKLPGTVGDEILADDQSADDTVALAGRLGLKVVLHGHNRGYGVNQKTCYAPAIAAEADIVVMLHQVYQYSCGVYDLALGSRILGRQARKGGLPAYKAARTARSRRSRI